MNSVLNVLQEKSQLLSLPAREELLHYAEFLLQKEQARPPLAHTEPSFDWADGPDDEPVTLSSVELQHLATEYRIEQELDLK